MWNLRNLNKATQRTHRHKEQIGGYHKEGVLGGETDNRGQMYGDEW